MGSMLLRPTLLNATPDTRSYPDDALAFHARERTQREEAIVQRPEPAVTHLMLGLLVHSSAIPEIHEQHFHCAASNCTPSGSQRAWLHLSPGATAAVYDSNAQPSARA
eukprot:6181879-Pleurochrysis_carterae.AAC.1